MPPIRPQQWLKISKEWFTTTKDWIWGQQPFNQAAHLAQRLIRAILSVLSSASRGDLQLNAMSLSYTTLLSLVPLLAVTFSVLKAFGSSAVIEPFLLSLMAPLGDAADELTARLLDFVQNIRVGVLGAVGVALLFFTVVALMQRIERVFNSIWHVHQLRSLSSRFSNYLSVLLVGPVLVIAASSLTAGLFGAPIIRDVTAFSLIGTLFNLLGYLLPLMIWTAVFAFLYIFIPNTRVKFSAALVGGLVAAILWNLFGYLFGGLIAGSTNLTAIYSAFASLVLFMVWLQIAWMIVLVGAGISYAWQYSDRLILGRPRAVHPAVRLAAGIVLFDTVESAFERGAPPPDRDELAQRVQKEQGLENVWIDSLLEKLLDAELLRSTEQDSRMGFLPARPGSAITLADIETALEGEIPTLSPALLEKIPALARFAEVREQLEDDLEATRFYSPYQGEESSPAASADAPRQ
ncbi:YihY/virulence factor BrkB family protein [Guyparkeria sp. 1SP6A2]|nr:YihY/virulence factor BrkB family protein [Guyparkeria sp. 1SP6A2]